MAHLGLLGLVSFSYLATLLIYRRARLLSRRGQGPSPRLLRRLHVRAALAPLVREAPELAELVDPLEVGRIAEARSTWDLLAASLRVDRRPWVEAVFALAEAERERRPLRRYALAIRARKEAARARRATSEAAPTYLHLTAALGYLVDPLNLELALWQGDRRLRRGLAQRPKEPLLHLSAALRAAVAGETAEALQALARALYHSRGDRFVAALIVGLPGIAELDPAVAAEASRLLEATPEQPAAALH